MRRFIRLAVVTSVAVPALALATPPAVHAVTGLPGGFSEQVVATGLSSPTAVEALPDGRIVVLEKPGRVRVVKNGVLLAASALTRSLGSCSGGEQGFLGFAVDASFAVNRYVFLYYTRPSGGGCVNRVSRFQFNATLDTIDSASETVLLDNIPGTLTDGGNNHNGGDLEIGTDGLLYVSIGDSGCDPRGDSDCAGLNDAAQDLGLLSGKIVRINTDGTPAATNPLLSDGSAATCRTSGVSVPSSGRCRELYAWGLRNPYRFAFDPNTSNVRFYINDVGQAAREEVDNGLLGANYGWNCREGRIANPRRACAPNSAFVDPITDYGRAYGAYITAGAFVPNGAWPSEYDGAYLFADGSNNSAIYRWNSNGTVNYDAAFARNLGVVAHMSFIVAGDRWGLYYTDVAGGALRRIIYNNPVAPAVSNLVLDSVTPKRIYDTRVNIGNAGRGLLLGGGGRMIDAQAPAGARAALVNISIANVRGGGFLQVWLPRTRIPTAAILNSPGAGVASNTAIVPLDSSGRFNIRSTVSASLIVDVMGYYRPAASATAPDGRLHALAPVRLIDTAQPAGAANSYSAVGDRIVVPVRGLIGVPPTGAKAVVLALTARSQNAATGFVTLYPSNVVRPTTANVNTNVPSDARSNMAIIPIAPDGTISAYLSRVNSISLDVLGWIGSSSGPAFGDGALTLIAASRRVDTRTGLGFTRFSANSTRTVDLNPALPAGAGLTAVLQNDAVTRSAGAGVVRSYPAGGSPGATTTVAIGAAGQTRPSLAITRLPANGSDQVSYQATIATDLVVDVYGYFT